MNLTLNIPKTWTFVQFKVCHFFHDNYFFNFRLITFKCYRLKLLFFRSRMSFERSQISNKISKVFFKTRKIKNDICFGRFNAISKKYILKFFSKIFFQNFEIFFKIFEIFFYFLKLFETLTKKFLQIFFSLVEKYLKN